MWRICILLLLVVNLGRVKYMGIDWMNVFFSNKSYMRWWIDGWCNVILVIWHGVTWCGYQTYVIHLLPSATYDMAMSLSLLNSGGALELLFCVCVCAVNLLIIFKEDCDQDRIQDHSVARPRIFIIVCYFIPVTNQLYHLCYDYLFEGGNSDYLIFSQQTIIQVVRCWFW